MIDISGHLRRTRRECGYVDKENYITVNCCGYQKFITKNFTRRREKGRLDYQMIYITKGNGIYYLDNQWTPIQEGNIVIYPPGIPQHYHYYFEHNPEAYWIHFTGYGAEECLEKAGVSERQVVHVGISNQCVDLYKKIMHELQIKRAVYEQTANAYFLELLARISRRLHELPNQNNRTKDTNLQKIIETMHTQYNHKWSVKDFSNQCNLSTYRFIHNFKALTGMSPIEYLTAIRIDKAKELLLSSSLNISEISGIIGYDNPLYFSRVFKKITGFSPSSYREATG